jgi:hypothetical protein
MLPERYQRLLTAFVDGELTTRRQAQVERLLARSAEARRFLRRLQRDADAIRSLPPIRPTRDLAPVVLDAIAAGSAATKNGPVCRAAPRTLPAWGAAAVAAVLLVGIGLASFLFFSRPIDRPRGAVVARLHRQAPATGRGESKGERPDVGRAASPTRPPRSEPPANAAADAATAPRVAKRSPDRKDAPKAPPAKAAPDAILTDRLEMFQIDKADVTLPVTFKVRNLDQQGVRKQLLAELRKAEHFRLELPCHGGTTAFALLEPALRALGLGVTIDQAAQQRLWLPQLRTNYVIYVEDLLPEELPRLLEAAARQDQKAARKSLRLEFNRLVLTRMTPRDHQELSTLLGTDPNRPASPADPLARDPRQPLTDVTARQVAESLAGQGGTPRSDKTTSTERLAIVLAFNPVRPPAGSAEVQRFLRARKPPRPGSIRVLLVLRG